MVRLTEAGPNTVSELLLRVFHELDAEKVCYCLMRDYERLDQLDGDRDVDLLVEEGQLEQASRVLQGAGFLRRRIRGHEPHHFFVGYDHDRDLWLELDVVTEVACGRPIYALRTGLAAGCLRNRIRRDPTFVPCPEDELVMLLLHCVLDKGYFAPARGERLQKLVQEVSEESYLCELLATRWPPGMSWAQLATTIRAGDWDRLLGERAAVARCLVAGDRIGTLRRKLSGRFLRQLNRWQGVLRPHGLSVALLAPDGAGKTTLARGLEASFYFPVRLVYMGPYSGASGRHLPVLGLIGRVMRQWWRYLRARCQRMRGRMVIFDRYGYDALAPPRPPRTRLARAHAWVMSRACPAPDLVLVLDAPGEVLHARKAEGTAAVLEGQRQRYLALQSSLRNMIVVDATPDAETVRRKVTALIWRRYARKTSGDRRA